MTEQSVLERLQSLEERYAHQEAALDEITLGFVKQGRVIEVQAEAIERLEAALRALGQASSAAIVDEMPPHY